MKIPAYEVKEQSQDRAVACLAIPQDLPFFKGHFPSQPILPAVVQALWMQELAKDLLGVGLDGSVPSVKFTAPLLPGDRIEILLELKRDKGMLYFEIRRIADGQRACKGRFRIEEG